MERDERRSRRMKRENLSQEFLEKMRETITDNFCIPPSLTVGRINYASTINHGEIRRRWLEKQLEGGK